MGLREEIQTDLGEAFDTDLADAVLDFSITQNAKGGYNPASGGVTPPSTTVATSRGVFDSYTELEIFNSAIEPNDSKIIILANEIEFAPRIGDIITRTMDAKVFRVIQVEIDPAYATYTCQVRGTKS